MISFVLSCAEREWKIHGRMPSGCRVSSREVKLNEEKKNGIIFTVDRRKQSNVKSRISTSGTRQQPSEILDWALFSHYLNHSDDQKTSRIFHLKVKYAESPPTLDDVVLIIFPFIHTRYVNSIKADKVAGEKMLESFSLSIEWVPLTVGGGWRQETQRKSNKKSKISMSRFHELRYCQVERAKNVSRRPNDRMSSQCEDLQRFLWHKKITLNLCWRWPTLFALLAGSPKTNSGKHCLPSAFQYINTTRNHCDCAAVYFTPVSHLPGWNSSLVECEKALSSPPRLPNKTFASAFLPTLCCFEFISFRSGFSVCVQLWVWRVKGTRESCKNFTDFRREIFPLDGDRINPLKVSLICRSCTPFFPTLKIPYQSKMCATKSPTMKSSAFWAMDTTKWWWYFERYFNCDTQKNVHVEHEMIVKLFYVLPNYRKHINSRYQSNRTGGGMTLFL